MKKIMATALLATVLIFSMLVGILLFLENSRVEEVKRTAAEIDVLWNDARLFSEYAANASSGECDYILEENMRLGDRIYNEGLKIENYDDASKFTDAILTEKKRYALLDLQFWKNSLEVKKACNSSFSTVIFFYSQYNETDEQKIEDRILWNFKQKCGPKIIYITFPADMGLSSINLIKSFYNVTKIPSVVIDEKTVLTGVIPLEELNKYVRCE